MADLHSLGLPVVTLPQTVVVNRNEYVVSYQQVGPYTFIHVHFNKWGPEVLKQYRRDAELAFDLHGGPVYSWVADPKQRKFNLMFGFRPTGVADANGELFIKEK